MNKNIIRLAAIAALAVGAQAANIVKTASSPGTFVVGTSANGGLPDGTGLFSYSIDIPQLTPAEEASMLPGNFVGVTYEISVGTYVIGTLIGNAGSYAVSWGLAPIDNSLAGTGLSGNGPFGGPGISIFADIAGAGSTLEAAAFNAPLPTYTTTSQVETTGALDDSANSAQYQGAGNVTFAFTAKAFTGVGGISGNTAQTAGLAYQGATVKVTYVFSDVPEPSTYAAGAVLLAGAGFIARRRMQKA
jgi:hypothetical protein